VTTHDKLCYHCSLRSHPNPSAGLARLPAPQPSQAAGWQGRNAAPAATPKVSEDAPGGSPVPRPGLGLQNLSAGGWRAAKREPSSPAASLGPPQSPRQRAGEKSPARFSAFSPKGRSPGHIFRKQAEKALCKHWRLVPSICSPDVNFKKVSKYNLAVENSSERPVLRASDLHPGLVLHFFSKTIAVFT